MSFSQGSVSSATAKMVRMIRMTIAAPAPQRIACFCCFGGSERAASAITTALSPDRTMLTPMILARPIQKACVRTSSRSRASSGRGTGEAATRVPAGLPAGPAF